MSNVPPPVPPLPPVPPAPPPIPYASPAPPSLSPEQIAQLQQTRKQFTKVRRATSVALLDGWTSAIFGGLTAVLSFLSIPALALGLGLVIIGYLQLRAVTDLKRLDDRSLTRMAAHQIALGILLFCYAAVSLWQVQHGPSLIASAGLSDPQLADMVGSLEDVARQLMVALYLSLMVVALVGSGLMALYYRSRQKYVQAYRDQTPQWILDLQQAGMSI